MIVGLVRVEYHLPACHSLKEKRSPLKSLLAKLRERFQCAVAEVGCQELHQRASVGVAVVAVDGRHLAERMAAVLDFLRDQPEMMVLAVAETTVRGPESEAGFR